MRKLTALTAFAVVVGSLSAASAANASMKDYGPAPVWNGMYVGGHVGAVWNDSATYDAAQRYCRKEHHKKSKGEAPAIKCSDWTKMDNVTFEQNDDDVSLIGGVQIGRNWQFGNRVLGVEGDVSFADGLDYLASLRLRAGVAQDNLLLYVTGGVAFAGFDKDPVKFSHYGHTHELSNGDGDEQRIGAVIGAGAEYKLRPNMSIGVEGLYYAFSDSNNEWGKSYYRKCWGTETLITEDDDNDLFVVRGRLNYHFTDDRYEPLK
jgi:outer membrane immunogenic protein